MPRLAYLCGTFGILLGYISYCVVPLLYSGGTSVVLMWYVRTYVVHCTYVVKSLWGMSVVFIVRPYLWGTSLCGTSMTYVVYPLSLCGISVVLMWYICNAYVVHLIFRCSISVILVCHLSHTGATLRSYLCHTSVILVPHFGHTCATLRSYWCHTSVILVRHFCYTNGALR